MKRGGLSERVRDTVVQVFSQVAEIDIRQPYKTPSQYKVSGSGFFINDKGDLITNAHVVSQAKSVWIQIPHFGKRIFDTTIIGFAPDYDLALLRIDDEGLALMKRELGNVPWLSWVTQILFVGQTRSWRWDTHWDKNPSKVLQELSVVANQI